MIEPGRKETLSREKIISVAAWTFYENGFGETTLSHIALKLGVTDKAIYYYFLNKDALYLDTVNTCTDRMARVIKSIQVIRESGLGKLKSFVRAVVRRNGDLLPYSKTLPDHLTQTEQGKSFMAAEHANDEILIDWIRQGISDGSIWPADPKILWKWNQGALIWLDLWSQDSHERNPEFLEAMAITMLDRSLGNSGTPPPQA